MFGVICKKPILLFLSLMFFVVSIAMPSTAENKSKIDERRHPIDLWFEAEISKDWSTAGMLSAAVGASQKWDVELNAQYKRLMALLSDEEKKLLRDAERKWIEYRDAEFRLLDIVQPPEGTMFIPMTAGSKLDIIRRRALDLEGYASLFSTKGKAFPLIEGSLKTIRAEQAEAGKRVSAQYDILMPLIRDRTFRDEGETYVQRKSDKKFLRDSQQKWISFRDAESEFLDALQKRGVMSLTDMELKKRDSMSRRADDLFECISLFQDW